MQRRSLLTCVLVTLGGCLAGWQPPATEGWDHGQWVGWDPIDPLHPNGPGQAYRWTVPEGTTRVLLTAWGAGGGGSVTRSFERVARGHAAGSGGLAIAEVEVVPGEVLLVVPGRGGDAGGSRGAGVWVVEDDLAPWLGGGGPGAPAAGADLPRVIVGDGGGRFGCQPVDPGAVWACTGAGAGGGWSGVFRATDLDAVSHANALVVAGGGGGGGSGGPGGAGGGERGEDAPPCGFPDASHPGLGGLPDAPAVLGVRAIFLEDPLRVGGVAGPLRGGSGGYANPFMALGLSRGGTRGGGGWFGGSGGAASLPGHPGCGGGGGSSWASGLGVLVAGGAPAMPAMDGATWGLGGAAGRSGGHGGVRIQW